MDLARFETRDHTGFSVRTTTIPIAARHGVGRLVDALGVRPPILAALARSAGEFDPRDAVFFDVETTGFGGDDTLVFLVGTARLSHDRVSLEQWLLVDEKEESAFLDAILTQLCAARPLVTFVGKSFDRHRVDDRFEIHRSSRPLASLPHADLYHAARRLIAGRLRDGRLATIERERLGIHRGRDLTGAECPEAWLDFVETRDPGFVEPVLRHNLLDLLALCALLPVLNEALTIPMDAAGDAAAAGFFAAAGRDDLAAAPYSRLAQALPSTDPRVEEARRRATRRARRSDDDASGPDRTLVSRDDPQPDREGC